MGYTTRKGSGTSTANAFETLLALTGITQKTGRPHKPTTQGKIERFWQTLKPRLPTQTQKRLNPETGGSTVHDVPGHHIVQ